MTNRGADWNLDAISGLVLLVSSLREVVRQLDEAGEEALSWFFISGLCSG